MRGFEQILDENQELYIATTRHIMSPTRWRIHHRFLYNVSSGSHGLLALMNAGSIVQMVVNELAGEAGAGLTAECLAA